METQAAASFFSKDRMFYKRLFTILLTVSLQNVVAYSVNMADKKNRVIIEEANKYKTNTLIELTIHQSSC